MSDEHAAAIPGSSKDRLVDAEELMASREAKLLAREQELIKQERAYIGRCLALDEGKRTLCDGEVEIHQRAVALGEPALVIARLTSERSRGQEEAESLLSYGALELAPSARKDSLEAREEALVSRLEALAARRKALGGGERSLLYEEELLQVRQQEKARMEAALTELARAAAAQQSGVASAAPPPIQTSPPPPAVVGAGPSGGPPAPISPPSAGPPDPPALDQQAGEDERRRQPRYGLKVYVGVESENTFFTGFSRNISKGGVFIASHDVMEMGQEVELLFSLPGGAAIETRGHVAWLRPYNPDTPDVFPGLGIKFDQLSEEAARSIAEFLAEQEPLFPDEEG